MVDLRAAHEKKDGMNMGVDALGAGVKDMEKLGIIEPLRVKEQAIKSATEAACMILRIDDVIASAKAPPAPKMPPGGPGGPGGMGMGM